MKTASSSIQERGGLHLFPCAPCTEN